jgi:hypothetical protein
MVTASKEESRRTTGENYDIEFTVAVMKPEGAEEGALRAVMWRSAPIEDVRAVFAIMVLMFVLNAATVRALEILLEGTGSPFIDHFSQFICL